MMVQHADARDFGHTLVERQDVPLSLRFAEGREGEPVEWASLCILEASSVGSLPSDCAVSRRSFGPRSKPWGCDGHPLAAGYERIDYHRCF